VVLTRRAFLAAFAGAAVAGGRSRWKRRARQVTVTDRVGLRDVARATNLTIGTPNPAVLLIKYGQDIPTIALFAGDSALYDSRPFDGWVIEHSRSVSWLSATPISQATFAADFAGFPTGLTRSTHNFLRLLMLQSGAFDWFDNAFWSTACSNLTNLCAALAASGRQFDGVFFDTESYGTTDVYNFGGDFASGQTTAWLPNPSTITGAVPSGTTALSARNIAAQRGEEIMDAATAGWPAVKMWTTHLPGMSEEITYSHTDGVNWGNNAAWANDMQGAFIYGMAASTYTTGAQWWDGAEFGYGVRDSPRAARLRAWCKTGWPTNSPLIVPSGERATFTTFHHYAPAMYDRDEFNAYALHTAANLQAYLTYQLRVSDGYAWLYTEEHQWGVGGGTPVPQSYVDAVTNAKAGV